MAQAEKLTQTKEKRPAFYEIKNGAVYDNNGVVRCGRYHEMNVYRVLGNRVIVVGTLGAISRILVPNSEGDLVPADFFFFKNRFHRIFRPGILGLKGSLGATTKTITRFTLFLYTFSGSQIRGDVKDIPNSDQ